MTFARRIYTPPPSPPVRPATRRASYATTATQAPPIPKENALQHQAYMDIVRSLPCIRCGKAPRSQFCHADEGKGTGIKTDCRRGWPGCAFCHHLIGTSGTFDRETKRRIEQDYGQRTRGTVLLGGLWPMTLPKWTETTTP